MHANIVSVVEVFQGLGSPSVLSYIQVDPIIRTAVRLK